MFMKEVKKYILLTTMMFVSGCEVKSCSSSAEKAFVDAKFLMSKSEVEQSLSAKLSTQKDASLCAGEFENMRNQRFIENNTRFALTDIELYGYFPGIAFCFDRDRLYNTQIEFKIESLEKFNDILERTRIQLSKSFRFVKEVPYTNGLNAVLYVYDKGDYGAEIRAIKPDKDRKDFSVLIDKWYKPIVDEYEFQKKKMEQGAF